MSLPLPSQPQGPKKAFVAYLDTYFGSTTAKKFIQAGVEVSGLLKSPQGLIPNKAKVVRRSDSESVRRALLEADFVVYELVDSVDDAVSAIRLLTTNIFDNPKRFVLVSSFLSWFETPLLRDVDPLPPISSSLAQNADAEPITEEQYNRRVPHAKYLSWRDVEKLCGSVESDRLQTFIVFSGLQYGAGENFLGPLFKQGWCLGDEGLPIYGTGSQVIPMIHVFDVASIVFKLSAVLSGDDLPSNRYIFAVDDAISADEEEISSWGNIVGSINKSLGNGKTFNVPAEEYCLHDGVEHFTIDLRVEAQTAADILSDDEWVCKSGFVQNIEGLVDQYRRARGVTPLRVVVLGPPLSGKSYAARELSAQLNIPHFTVDDAISEYKYQLTELGDELERLRILRRGQRTQELKDEKIQAFVEERRIAAEEEAQQRAEMGMAPHGQDEDEDDLEEEEEFEVNFTQDEMEEINAFSLDDDADDRALAIKDRMEEVRRVLAMKLKPIADLTSVEPPNPKDKKKNTAAKQVASRKKSVVGAGEDIITPSRLSDRALAIILKWRLTRTQCRNQGYILDGFPKTVRQARLLFEDAEVEVFADPDEPDLPLDNEVKPFSDAIFPEFLIRCAADDTFLLERLQRVQHEHPHNNPDDFQRRLDSFKQNFVGVGTVFHLLENARSTSGRKMKVQQDISMEDSPVVPPPPPKSQFAPKQIDINVQKMMDFIGKPHNFGPTPQDAKREAERRRMLLLEENTERELSARHAQESESKEVRNAKRAKDDETLRLNQMKEQERRMLEERKAPLKAYLMRSVIPILTKGLIEVCNKRPEDPVDYLAEWLFRHNPEDDSMY